MVQCVTPATNYAAQGHTVRTKFHKKLTKMPNPNKPTGAVMYQPNKMIAGPGRMIQIFLPAMEVF